jgi:glucose-1-phosphate thymidylyltransferase
VIVRLSNVGRLLERRDSDPPAGANRNGLAPRAVLMVDSGAAGGDADLHLLPVANRPVILRVLDAFGEAGVHEVAVAVDPRLARQTREVLESDQAWPFDLTYLTPAGGGSLIDAVTASSQCAHDTPLLLHWACGLFKASLGSLLGGATVGPLDAVLLVDRPRADAPVADLAWRRLAAATGRPSPASGGLAGVALLGGRAPDVARSLGPSRGSDLDVLALVERMARLGGRVRALPADACWRYTGAADSALDLNRFLLSDLVAESPEPESPEAIVQGPVQMDSSAVLERATVRGPVVIGARARLIDAWIGPYTSIGEDVCVEGAEIENSILLGGTRISHLDQRLEASVVGPDATVCRDFRLPRALRLRVGDGATVALT